MCNNSSPLEGGMYINHVVKFSGKSRIILKLFNILKIWMVSDKTIHMACRIHKTLWTEKKKTIREISYFHY